MPQRTHLVSRRLRSRLASAITLSLGATATVVALTSTAFAQPAPEPAPPPGEPAPGEPAPGEPVVEPTPVPPEPEPAASTAPSDKKPVSVKYDKGFILETDDGQFEIKLNFRNQLRFEVTKPLEDNAQFISKFSVPRSRIQVEGHMWGQEARYKLEFGMGDNGSFAFIKDVFGEKSLGGAWLRVGQWKRPFNRQELVSDFASSFNERAITSEFTGGGRDIGVAIHNDYEKSPEGLEWIVGAFNAFNGGNDRPKITTTCTADAMTGAITCANSAATTVPADWSPAVVARVGYNHGGIKGYSEADLEGGPLRFAVGASYKVDLAQLEKGTQASVADNMSHGAQVDAMVKVEGFDALVGVYLMKLKAGDAEIGGLAQAGYFLTPKQMQVAARFAFVPVGDQTLLEARGAFNWYWHNHAFKITTDAGMLVLTGENGMGVSDKPDLQLRSMMQLTF